MKSTRSFRLSVAALLEFLSSARLIQLTQKPLVGIVTHGPFTAAHVHPNKPTQFADSVSRQRLGTHVSRIRLSVHLSQAPVSHPLELLATRVPADQRVLMQRCDHGVTLTVCRDSGTAPVPKIHQLPLDPQRSRARRDGCEQLTLPA